MSDHGTEYKGTQYDFSDMKRHGAGIWFAFHSMSTDLETVEERLFMCKRIRRVASIFKCAECRVHFLAYIQANPPEDTVGTPAGLFFWTVEFRNEVQRRIMREKNITLSLYDPQIMFEIFHDMDAGVCEHDCSGDKNTPSTATTTTHSAPPTQPRQNGIRYNREDYIQVIARNGAVQWVPRTRPTPAKSEGFVMYGR